jgi:hypothetical protein
MFHYFSQSTQDIALPERFTWPFHYEPHPLCRMAADEVKHYIASRAEWHAELGMGKMFGVLVVKNQNNEIGFLAAFSGNLAGSNHHEYFVPAVYDMLQPDDFFRRGEAEISVINQKIKDIEASEDYRSRHEALKRLKESIEKEHHSILTKLASGDIGEISKNIDSMTAEMCKESVLTKMLLLTVNRNEILWFYKSVQNLEFFLTGMT